MNSVKGYCMWLYHLEYICSNVHYCPAKYSQVLPLPLVFSFHLQYLRYWEACQFWVMYCIYNDCTSTILFPTDSEEHSDPTVAILLSGIPGDPHYHCHQPDYRHLNSWIRNSGQHHCLVHVSLDGQWHEDCGPHLLPDHGISASDCALHWQSKWDPHWLWKQWTPLLISVLARSCRVGILDISISDDWDHLW